MLSLLIGLAVTAIAAWLIVRQYQPQTVLLVAGLILLGLTAVFYPDHSVLYQKARSIGWKGFDVFAFVKDSLTTQIAGVGLIIMSSAAFADYMDRIGATGTMVRICIRPLRALRAPYVVLALSYVLGQALHIAIPSAAGLAMLLMVTLFPMLVSLGISKASAAATIVLTSFMDLGPAVGTANLGAKTAGMPVSLYFVKHQLPLAACVVPVVAVLVYVTARRFDRILAAHAGHPAPAADARSTQGTGRHGLYALLPLFPIALILVFSPLVGSRVSMDVVTAMLLSAVIGLACEVAVKRDVVAVFKDFQVFFQGIGASFAGVVSLLVCADVFAQGLQAIGAVGFVIEGVRSAGLSVHVMSVVMTLLVGVTGMITGSGVAAFFSFAGLAPGIAAKFGVTALTMVLPMQLMAGMGRAVSPVAGVVIAVSKGGECSGFEIVRRTLIPALGGSVAMILANYLLNG